MQCFPTSELLSFAHSSHKWLKLAVLKTCRGQFENRKFSAEGIYSSSEQDSDAEVDKSGGIRGVKQERTKWKVRQ